MSDNVTNDDESSQSKESMRAISGAGMDRRVEGKKKPWRIMAIAGAVAVLAFLAFLLLDVADGRNLSVSADRVTISKVVRGKFEDFVPIRGRVTPLNTVYLDAIEGGRIERILVEDGAQLEEGDLIVELSNTTLQLDVTRNEAVVTEQLNNIRRIELELEQNRLSHKRNLIEINYQMSRLEKKFAREQKLMESRTISRVQLENTLDELEYYRNRRMVTLESQKTDARLQDAQLVFLTGAGARLERNLELSRKNLDALNVRAPVAGTLSGFNIEVGQSIAAGGRLGQVDDADDYKVVASIDEFYLDRIDIGQLAVFERGGKTYTLRVNKIYPQVKNGQFEADLVFSGQQPDGIRRGQTLQAKLTLGDPEDAVLVPNGPFLQDTGGNWIFVVAPDGGEAIRRNVRLARLIHREHGMGLADVV
ncbi:efflux RND transporter periplasmic adaptor subunit [Sphingosinicella soli]|uniref:HlyD family secretion protein n=1 Tax=Sphingosinicella soli TaxID=333708 RepID=A0A7W7B041_9SPHN|nr:HlyD family efflux transporter periplasmic adaptor subunit [Sphingosinicella soli]MBB4631586.1 HlyD family secretion protein [Sphingosinicella soli]